MQTTTNRGYKKPSYEDQADIAIIGANFDMVDKDVKDLIDNKAPSQHEHAAVQVKFTDGKTFQQKLDEGSLRGQQGIQGIQGVRGATGATGAKGDKGEKGDSGTGGNTTNLVDGITEGSLRGINSASNSTYTIGKNAVALGYNTRAIGENSYADGFGSFSKGLNSHSEGRGSVAETSVVTYNVHSFTHDTIVLHVLPGYENIEDIEEPYRYKMHPELVAGKTVEIHGIGNGNSKVRFTLTIQGVIPTNTIRFNTNSLMGINKINRVVLLCENTSDHTSAHAEGSDTISSGCNSHAEGMSTTAFGIASHSEGYKTTSIGMGTHSEGLVTYSSGLGSHSEGWCTVASYNTHRVKQLNTSETSTTIYIDKKIGMEFFLDSTKYPLRIQYISLVYEESGVDLVSQNIGYANIISSNGTMLKLDKLMPENEYIVNIKHTDAYTSAYGIYSIHAEGIKNIASGTGSHVEGCDNYATGAYTHVEGASNIAFGRQSHVEGQANVGVYENTHAEGYNTSSIGGSIYYRAISSNSSTYEVTCELTYGYEDFGYPMDIDPRIHPGISVGMEALVMSASGKGERNKLKNIIAPNIFRFEFSIGEGVTGVSFAQLGSVTDYPFEKYSGSSHSEGEGTSAIVACSHSEGLRSISTGIASHAEGYETQANGFASHAEGIGTIAYNSNSHAQGRSNKKVSDNDIFWIGNGTADENRSNAFRVTRAGATYGMSAFNSTGADYAEFFEWVDGNPNNEDRVGRFVTFSDDKIKIANTNDDYILGVISGNPSVIGNSYNDMWNEMYIRDEFNRIVYEDVEVLGKPNYIKHRMKINPLYDPNKKYIPREQRPEWSAVGMLGVLSVYDDGTCIVNRYAKVSDNGTATKADNGYRVLKRVTGNIIKILFRS